MKKENKSNPYHDYEPIISDLEQRIHIFKKHQKPSFKSLVRNSRTNNLMQLILGVVMLFIITILVIAHIIKGYNWLPIALLFIPTIPFVLTLVRQLEE